jgi:hypothetical protein
MGPPDVVLQKRFKLTGLGCLGESALLVKRKTSCRCPNRVMFLQVFFAFVPSALFGTLMNSVPSPPPFLVPFLATAHQNNSPFCRPSGSVSCRQPVF